MATKNAIMTTSITGYSKRSGKVRDVYDLGDSVLLVASDRISAYDVVMPNGIPDKGRVLTQISLFWFEMFAKVTANHIISDKLSDLPAACRSDDLAGRFMLCKKAKVVPIECIVRGYITGSGWKEYQKSSSVCGIKLPAGLKQCDKLPSPIFTPTTKAEVGHDESISFEEGAKQVGGELMAQLRDKSIEIYSRAADYAATRGIILADTKFEWGIDQSGKLLLIDELLTPDSSRFWPADGYKPGADQPSFDKQFLRNWLDEIKFNRKPPAPTLPDDIVNNTRRKYIEAFTRITGKKFQWE